MSRSRLRMSVKQGRIRVRIQGSRKTSYRVHLNGFGFIYGRLRADMVISPG